MAIFPGAISRLVTASKGRQRLTSYHRLNLHVAVSESASLYDQFNRTGQVDSHFYVRRDGTVEQYVDTAWRAFADLDGNDATISVETQGGVTNPDSEPWTAAQLEVLAQLYAWVVRTHGIAHKIATSSHADERSHGLSWHRLGIDGNFPALPDVRAGRTQRGGGMHYSSAGGKICPGAGKIYQIPGIFDRTTQILGGTAPDPTTPPTEDDMTPDQDARLARIEGQLAELCHYYFPGKPGVRFHGDAYRQIETAATQATAAASQAAVAADQTKDISIGLPTQRSIRQEIADTKKGVNTLIARG